MAAIDVKSINWNEIAEEVGEGGRKSSGMVEVIDQACREIMKTGKPYTINRLTNMIEMGLNQGLTEGEEKVKVNWSTVSHTMKTHDGFKLVDDNTYVLDGAVKKNHGKRSAKITAKKH
jgi:hypothetical protein